MIDLDDRDRQVGERFARLHRIMRELRSSEGCPWDRAQDLKTLRGYLLEETYELLEAIDSGDVEHHREELGDVLFQAVFQAQIRAEQDQFDLGDAAQAISDKLVHRHPHVFGDGDKKDDPEAVRVAWEDIKRREKAGRRTLDGVPQTLPALLRAVRIGEKAASVGFDWTEASQVRAKVVEELAEFDEALQGGDRQRAEDELGDLLFALASYARHLKLSPEDALRRCVDRFRQRFERVEDKLGARGQQCRDVELETLEALWQEAKAELG